MAFGAGGSGRGAHGRALRWLRDLFGLVEGRGACHLPDGVARLAASALRVFADDVRSHERGPCLAARGRPCSRCRPGQRDSRTSGRRWPGPGRHAVSKRLRVNPILCEAHGVCAELLPS